MRIPLDLPPGINGDDTQLAAKGRWADGSNVRFRLGKPEVIGGWESLISTALTGACRSIFPWKDASELLNIGFGTHSKLQVWKSGGLYDITPFGPPDRLGNDPLASTNASGTVVVTHTAHGYTTGLSLKIFGAATFNGLDAANLNITATITVIDANSYSFTAGAGDTASATGAGGGANVVVTPQTALPAGAVNGTGSAGFGTGAYGVGPYGTTSLTTEYYARTWSMAAWDQYLLASPRNGGIYKWTGDTSQRAVVVDNAPVQVTYMLVAPRNGGYQVFALGCDQEADGVFNSMCIRHSSVRKLTEWSSTASGSTAREYILTGGGRIVGARMCGAYMLVWTDRALWLGTFVGSLDKPWAFDPVGQNCGLIGPNAAVVVGQTAYWLSQDRQFYRYGLGGEPQPVPCPILTDLGDNLAASQGDKVTASTNAEFSEIRFDYPDARDGYENSRYVALAVNGPDAGVWYRGIMARTSMVDAGSTPYPVGVTYDATADTGQIFYHEKGKAADGATFAWHIETADQLLDVDWRLLVKGVWPDFRGQLGPVWVTLTARERPQGEATVTSSSGMAPTDAKADLLMSGRFFQVKFSGESSPTACRIGTPVFEVERCGKM